MKVSEYYLNRCAQVSFVAGAVLLFVFLLVISICWAAPDWGALDRSVAVKFVIFNFDNLNIN